jgi:hypothetical protein
MCKRLPNKNENESCINSERLIFRFNQCEYTCVSDHLRHTLVEGRIVKAHNAINLEDSHNAELTSISSRTVADPGHLNQCSTATGSKASQWRRDFEFLQLNMHHSKGACFNLQHSLDRGLIDVALLQELWVYKSRVKGLNSKQGSIFVGTRAETRRACYPFKLLQQSRYCSCNDLLHKRHTGEKSYLLFVVLALRLSEPSTE